MDKTLVLKPRLSEKAYGLSANGTYVFDVPQGANKHTVARAVSAQYSVGVAKVNIVNLEGKAKRTVRKNGRATAGKQNDIRKAYVTLKQGETLPIFAALEEEAEKAEKTQATMAKAAEKAAKKEKK